jgi:hypothetical protein
MKDIKQKLVGLLFVKALVGKSRRDIRFGNSLVLCCDKLTSASASRRPFADISLGLLLAYRKADKLESPVGKGSSSISSKYLFASSLKDFL